LTTENFPRGTAYHEAGHAVVAWSFGVKIASVRVQADGEGGTDHPPGVDGHLLLEQKLEILAAGKAAEKLFGYRAGDLAAIDDIGAMWMLLSRHGIDDEAGRQEFISESERRALTRLNDHKNRVIRLAERLSKTGRVGFEEFQQLMQLA
jgi:ATP-dependent Zn protease